MRSILIVGAYLASVMALAACSGGSGALRSSNPLVASSWAAHVDGDVSPDVCAASKIYVADIAKSDVEIYSQGVTNPRPCGKITTGISGPEAVYVDAQGKLYVANFGTSTVTEYAGGKLKLTIPTKAPGFDVFVGSGRTVYVAEPNMNIVEEYAAGATTPFLTLSINGGPHGVATDSHNNLYVSYLSDTDGVSHVEKFAPKATTGTDLGFTISFSGEVKLDTQNDVVIGDRNNNDKVYIYPPGHIVPSRSFSTGANPINFSLNHAETLFYVSGFNAVQVMDFQTGTQVDSITTGLTSPSGVALFPPAPY